MRAYSESQLNGWEGCAYQALMDKRHKIPPAPPNEAGQLFHRWQENIEKQGGDTVEALTLIAGTATTKKLADDVIAMGKRWIIDHREEGIPIGDREKMTSFNARWSIVPNDSEHIRFRAIPDFSRVFETHIKIIDFKTTQLVPNPLPWKQLEIYAWIELQRNPHLDKVIAELDFVRFGFRPTFEFYRKDLAWVPIDLTARMAAVDKMIDKFISTGIMPATLNQYCGTCAHYSSCPILKNILESSEAIPGLLPPQTVESVQKIHQLLKLLDGASASAKLYLKQFVAENGPTQASETESYQIQFRNGRTPNTALVKKGVKNETNGQALDLSTT